MYHKEKEQAQRQAAEEAKQNYKTDEQLRKEFEEWRNRVFTKYDQTSHDEFLKNRYYKMRH